MAKRSNISDLPESTIITVVATKGKDIYVTDMPYGDAKKKAKSNKGFRYKFYQLGFCSIKPNKFLKPKGNGK